MRRKELRRPRRRRLPSSEFARASLSRCPASLSHAGPSRFNSRSFVTCDCLVGIQGQEMRRQELAPGGSSGLGDRSRGGGRTAGSAGVVCVGGGDQVPSLGTHRDRVCASDAGPCRCQRQRGGRVTALLCFPAVHCRPRARGRFCRRGAARPGPSGRDSRGGSEPDDPRKLGEGGQLRGRLLASFSPHLLKPRALALEVAAHPEGVAQPWACVCR